MRSVAHEWTTSAVEDAIMSKLRIFSYLPNPRIWKATIAGRLCGVEVEVRGASPKELRDWLWDFDARPLSEDERHASKDVRVGKVGFKGGRLYKTEAFLAAQPFGTVPAAFSPDGQTGIFESNSIMRAVARLGGKRFPLYGHDAYEASRIDSFLDASLVFARDAQLYLLCLMSDAVPPEIHARASDGFTAYMGGSNRLYRRTANLSSGTISPSRISVL
jgi:elongation factor 1-gamma